MDHHFRCGAGGTAEGYDDKYYFGRSQMVFIFPVSEMSGRTKKRDYIRGFGYQGAASRQGWRRDVAEMSIGGELKMHLLNPAMDDGMTAFGEILALS